MGQLLSVPVEADARDVSPDDRSLTEEAEAVSACKLLGSFTAGKVPTALLLDATPSPGTPALDSANEGEGRLYTIKAKQEQTLSKYAEGSLEGHCSGELGRLSGALSSLGSSLAGSMPAEQALPFTPHDNYLLGPPRPACHELRAKTIDAIYQMRAVSDEEIESMLRLLCNVFNTDTATFALLTGEVVYLTGACGALSPCVCPDRWGFCGWSFLNPHHNFLVVENMREDNRFAENFFVQDAEFNIQFYVAAPLIASNGHRLGTLCVMGREPRTWDAFRASTLGNLAEMMVRQLERRWALEALQAENQRLMRSGAAYDAAFLFVDTSAPQWRVLYMNPVAKEQLGGVWDGQPVDLTDLLLVASAQHSRADWSNAKQGEFTLRHVIGQPGTPTQGKRFTLKFKPAAADQLDGEAPLIGIPSHVRPDSEEGKRHAPGGNFFLVELADESGGNVFEPLKTPVLRTGPFDGLVLGPLVGKGGYGRVYRGVWQGHQVAVKVVEDTAALRLDASGQPLEAVVSRGCVHAGIVPLLAHAMHPAERECWMLFEFCDRGCLVDACVKGWFRTDRSPLKGGLDVRRVAVTALEIARAGAFLHRRGVVHGDLSGGNVMLTSNETAAHGFSARVSDFGLARTMDMNTRIQTNQYGTVTHMAPEILLSGTLSKAADVYAFGVLLWEMCTGTRAWAGLMHAQVMVQVALLKRPLATPEGLPSELGSLLARCLAGEMAMRPTFVGIAAELEELVDRLAELAAAAPPLAPCNGKERAAPLDGAPLPQAVACQA